MEYELKYQLFPRSFGITEEIRDVVSCFEKNYEKIKSPDYNLSSDGVLKVLAEDLKALNFRVEESKASVDKIKVPVLFSINNKIDKFFDADAVSADGKIVIEVEAGRGYRNNQFLLYEIIISILTILNQFFNFLKHCILVEDYNCHLKELF